MEEKREIKENKSPNLKVIENNNIVYTFTCKKCGAHSSRDIIIHTHKYGTTGSKVKVCTNCGWGDNLID